MIPHFIIDEELEELHNTIKDLIRESKHPELKKHVRTLKLITRAIAYSLAKPKRKRKIKKIQKRPIQFELIKQPIGYDISPVPSPGNGDKLMQEFKAVPIFAKHVIKKEPEKLKEKTIVLIKDKFTNKVLSTAKINKEYKVDEPHLDEKDRKVLEKVLKKKPKNPEKAWKLIEKYSKKYKVTSSHKEAIKYYAINSLFTLGKIEPLLQDKQISLITCNSPGSYIEIKRNNKTLKTNIIFNTKKELDDFLKIIAEKTKSKLDKKHPILDVTYRNFRFHCVLGLDITDSKFTITRIE